MTDCIRRYSIHPVQQLQSQRQRRLLEIIDAIAGRAHGCIKSAVPEDPTGLSKLKG
ncbi:MAG: hypothetical protein QOJ51_6638 [Acidobacteriaceae bacterium]|jgi:hypothetical protein|nr:hypothetical protein [Acidobacteriaceae bacterium]MDX6464261.1 hypothetical protein [Acidobacteriaceae bacterium]MEA2263813.1 hypothetical protein [Acidobacteriaceae bacterium]